MAQVLQVLLCVSCKTFQVQIKKKSNKWVCKLCGTKQSLQKVVAVGSGAECRKIVQELNLKRGQLLETEPNKTPNAAVFDDEEIESCVEEAVKPAADRNPSSQSQSQKEEPADSSCSSKWGLYIEEDQDQQNQVSKDDQENLHTLSASKEEASASYWNTYVQQGQQLTPANRNELY